MYGFLERGNLVGGKFHVHGCESVVEMVQLGGANDRSGDDPLGQQPSQCHLRPRNAPRRGDCRRAIEVARRKEALDRLFFEKL
jgi:hypothetical protein